MYSEASVALLPVPGVRPEEMRNCRTQVFTRNARGRSRIKAGIQAFHGTMMDSVQADMGTVDPVPTALHGTGISAKALTPVDSFAWDRSKC